MTCIKWVDLWYTFISKVLFILRIHKTRRKRYDGLKLITCCLGSDRTSYIFLYLTTDFGLYLYIKINHISGVMVSLQ
jgi:hypothetical protein